MTAVPPPLFDRALLRARQARATRQGAATFLIERAAEDLAERLGAVVRDFSAAADIGTPGDQVCAVLAPRVAAPAAVAIPDGAEHLALAPESLDLAVSALALHFVNDLPGVLAQIRRALRPDGLFLAVLSGGDTLTELRQALTSAEADVTGGAAPRVAPFADVRAMGGLLQRAGFALPVVDVERIVVRYANAIALMHDLRHMGATNVLHERTRTPLRRATLMRAVQIYAERFADPDGRIRATFDLIWLSGWAPHESQQQPLKPGSAQKRLADAVRATKPDDGNRA